MHACRHLADLFFAFATCSEVNFSELDAGRNHPKTLKATATRAIAKAANVNQLGKLWVVAAEEESGNSTDSADSSAATSDMAATLA